METPDETRKRWRYLRDLLIDQLGRLEDGSLKMHSNDVNVSDSAIAKIKRNIQDFDELISRNEARNK